MQHHHHSLCRWLAVVFLVPSGVVGFGASQAVRSAARAKVVGALRLSFERRHNQDSSCCCYESTICCAVENAVLSTTVPSSSRRDGLRAVGKFVLLGFVVNAFTFPMEQASAVAGTEAKIEMPNVMQGMQDRATKQCLVESLGNRECLVYAGDEKSRLYQGANNQVLLDRLEIASRALANVPEMIESKKWSQASGLLTGPMGELIRTMLQLIELSEKNGGGTTTATKKLVQTIKTDLYSLSAALDRRDGQAALQYHQAATDDLLAFVKGL